VSEAEDIVRRLYLKPHPEGGYYRETFRDSLEGQSRAASTAIYYLLRRGEVSHWHRIDAAEVWHWYSGAPLQLNLSHNGKSVEILKLGSLLSADQYPQLVVPRYVWQSARTLGDYTLVGCTVAPGFEFAAFEMAAPEWQPG
jgi:predicted cupin superfamily sugar epimerase